MNPLKKKAPVVVRPEDKVLEAGIHVDAQKSHFRKMAQEVKYAIGLRDEAVEEMQKEADALQAQLENKHRAILHAKDENRTDKAYLNEIRKFV